MKWLWAILLLLSPVLARAQTAAPISGFCVNGAKPAITSGLPSSNYNQNLIPRCTVQVFLAGSTNPATIYADQNKTPLTNPFTANTDGSWTFYVVAPTTQGTNQAYDVTLSGGIAPNVYTLPRTLSSLSLGGGGGATPAAPPSGSFQLNLNNVFASDQLAMWDFTKKQAQFYDVAAQRPKVDIRNPQYAGGADPTGVADSSNAVLAAYADLVAHPSATGVYPCLYVPTGTYIMTKTLRVTNPSFCIVGDSGSNSILRMMDPTVNLITIKAGGMTKGYLANFQLQGNGHLSSGTLLEVDDSYPVMTNGLVFVNNGGRCLALNGGAERFRAYDAVFWNCRWSLVESGNTNENKFSGLLVLNPGSDTGNYSWNVNAVNGVWPGPNLGQPVAATWAASTFYPHNAIVSDGSTNCSGGACNQQMTSASQICGATPPPYGAADGSTASDGVCTWANISRRTLVRPENHAAIVLSGQNNTIDGACSVKALIDQSGIIFGGETGVVSNCYFEGFLVKVPNHSVQTQGPLDHFVGTSTLNVGGLVASITNSQWMGPYRNDPADAQAVNIGGALVYVIVPIDYDAGSSAPSAVPGVAKNQYEYINVGAAASDGKLYIVNRNQSGSTAPANTTWLANNYFFFQYIGQGAGPVHYKNNHLEATQAPAAGYAILGTDNDNPAAEVLLGQEVDGQIIKGPGQGTRFPGMTNLFGTREIDLDGNITRTGPWDQGSIKAPIYGVVEMPMTTYTPFSSPTTSNWLYTTAPIIGTFHHIPTAWPGGNYSTYTLDYLNGFIGGADSSGTVFNHFYLRTAVGANNAEAQVFTNQYCFQDTPPASGGTTQANHQFCFQGDPAFGASTGFYINYFSAGGMRKAFGVSPNASLDAVFSTGRYYNFSNQFLVDPAGETASPSRGLGALVGYQDGLAVQGKSNAGADSNPVFDVATNDLTHLMTVLNNGNATIGATSQGMMSNRVRNSYNFAAATWTTTNSPTITPGQTDGWGGTTGTKIVSTVANTTLIDNYSGAVDLNAYLTCVHTKGNTGGETVMATAFNNVSPAPTYTLTTNYAWYCATNSRTVNLTFAFTLTLLVPETIFVDAVLTVFQGAAGSAGSFLYTGPVPLYLPTNGTPYSTPILATTQGNTLVSPVVLSGVTGSIGGSALAAGACATGTASITGATVGEVGQAMAADGTFQAGYVVSAGGTAAGTATVNVCAIVAGTPTAKTYNVRLLP
jgi:hypothetical protein